MTTLTNYGWNNFHQEYYSKNISKDLSVGRIISIKGFKYYLITEKREVETELSGKLLFSTTSEELPKVGDWVSFMDYESMGYVIEVFPRMNTLSRKNPGAKTEKQVLASNIDYALIVQGLDRDYNLMRIERYLVQITACGIKPVVILNKADLIANHEQYKNDILKLQRDCPVYFCSTYSGAGMDELGRKVLEKNKTYILIGSSGVGKSSILNALVNSQYQKINATSYSTKKGKHTTTTRDLFQLPNNSLMIDTPGMREFGLTFEDGQNSGELFPAIQQFASNCKFSNCKHLNESGCAVIEAVQAQELDAGVYDSYLKLIKEQRRFEINIEDKKRLGKQSGKMAREANNYRKKFKY